MATSLVYVSTARPMWSISTRSAALTRGWEHTVKVLAVSGRAREPELPDVQSAAEAGFPDVRAEAWIGVVAPRGTPKEVSVD